MDKNRKFCILGGDDRQAYLGEMLVKSGAFATFYALEKCHSAQPDFASLETAVSKCGCVILPMPLSKDGKTVNTPLSDITLTLDENLASLLSGKRIFTSNSALLAASGDYTGSEIIDYSKSEPLAVLNAVLTCEGAVAAAVNASPISLFESRCLVTGFGRIGKILSKYLSSLCADVTVSARKDADLAWIRALGYKSVSIDNIGEDIGSSGGYDYIFNTVPYQIFDRETLKKCGENAIYIELASKPFGADASDCRALHINHILASGLPGKTAARSAAKIIFDTIQNAMSHGKTG